MYRESDMSGRTIGNLILMTLVCVIIFWVFMALRPAKAANEGAPIDPKTLSNFRLACERMYGDGKGMQGHIHYEHAWLEILPSQNLVKRYNEKGEAVDLPVTKWMPSITSARNEFGHDVVISYVPWVWFTENGGTNVVRWTSRPGISYVYAGKNGDGQSWAYDCIIVR
jgi:hypothetical protein